MSTKLSNSYYITYGTWFTLFEIMVSVINAEVAQHFSVWVHKETNEKAMIIRGTPDIEDKIKLLNISKLSKEIYLGSFENKKENFKIYQYNEFKDIINYQLLKPKAFV